MKLHRSNRWQRQMAPPLAAWLGACAAQSGASVENTQTAPARAGSIASAGAGDQTAAAQGGSSQPPVQQPATGAGTSGSSAMLAGAGGMLAAGSGVAGGAGLAAAGVGGEPSRAGAGGVAGSAGAPAAGATAAYGGNGAAAGGGNAGAGGMDASGASFTQVYALFTAGCSCHSTGAGAGGLNLGSQAGAYTNLVAAAASACTGEQRVVAGDPDKSVLLHALARTNLDSCKVPKMPASAAMFSASDLETVRSWIAAGALNN